LLKRKRLGTATAIQEDVCRLEITMHSSLLMRIVDCPRHSLTHSGDHLITGGNRSTIRVWDLNIDSLMKTARTVAERELTAQEQRQYLKSNPKTK